MMWRLLTKQPFSFDLFMFGHCLLACLLFCPFLSPFLLFSCSFTLFKNNIYICIYVFLLVLLLLFARLVLLFSLIRLFLRSFFFVRIKLSTCLFPGPGFVSLVGTLYQEGPVPRAGAQRHQRSQRRLLQAHATGAHCWARGRDR